MCPSPYVMSVPLEVLHHMPAAVRHTMVALSLCYRLHRHELAGEIAWPKILLHRGNAIQNLNKTIGRFGTVSKKRMTREQSRLVDAIILSVIVFVSVEVRFSSYKYNALLLRLPR